jgi:hypothetical protein
MPYLIDQVFDCHGKALLLVRTSTNADGGEELPNINILTGVDRARKDIRQGRFKNIEESVIGVDPEDLLVKQKNHDKNLPLLPFMIINFAGMLDEFGSAQNHSQHADSNSCSSNCVNIDAEDETQNTRNNIQFSLSQVSQERWHDGH